MIWIRLETICPPLLGGLARCHPQIGARAGHISETVSVGRRLSVRETTDEMGNVKNRKVSTVPKIIQLSNWSSLFISCRYDIFPWIIFLSIRGFNFLLPCHQIFARVSDVLSPSLLSLQYQSFSRPMFAPASQLERSGWRGGMGENW